MSDTQHTPTPWVWGMRYVGRYTGQTVEGVNEYQKIAQAPSGEVKAEGSEWEANAKFIVLACNHHAELLAALEFARAKFCDPHEIATDPAATKFAEMADSLLAKVKGTT